MAVSIFVRRSYSMCKDLIELDHGRAVDIATVSPLMHAHF